MLDDSNLLGAPRYDKQCVENPEVFNFGEMYIGTAEVTVRIPGVLTNRFRGGELRLEFGVDITESEIEWIPLQIWSTSTFPGAAKRSAHLLSQTLSYAGL